MCIQGTPIKQQVIMTQRLNQDLYATDQELRFLEKQQLKSVYPQIQQKAKELGPDYFECFAIPEMESVPLALEYRYLYVPILYKLGMKEASPLAQATFEYLFPSLHKAIERRLIELFGKDYRQTCTVLIREFQLQNRQISHISARIKSTHSVWKKIPSLEALEQMSLEEFTACVNDFVGIRWEMNLPENNNRYDALINGVRLAPAKNRISFRNQQLPQSNGFDCEPVMKLYYVIDNIPVELQLLGGPVSSYMYAKGYASYKTKLPLSPSISQDQWDRRLAMSIKYNNSSLFRQYMLNELTGEQPDYSNFDPFLLDTSPAIQENQTLQFSPSSSPIYQLPSFDFRASQ
jgi:hypothetical protein